MLKVASDCGIKLSREKRSGGDEAEVADVVTRSGSKDIRTQVLTAIEALVLEGLIKGEKQPPPKFLLVHSGDNIEQQENPEFVNWKKTDKLLMSWIFSTLTPSVLGQVNGCKSSFEIWFKIERTYSQRSLARIMQLKQHMQSLKKGSDPISDFVVKIKVVGDALVAAGETASDRDMIMNLLNGVGHKYDW
ncbi:hypothetical protein Ddye_028451 [Dipteronia dyeriana]|uniref:Retrotransposon gag domain-containing protein n=1 Tax=Dipteronia dyeriana TaxID=168575 RepID=A0AAD9TRP0_9ROSI|nr:hypothetical protein Ddye_028451 [Dipteronia dyeriana]